MAVYRDSVSSISDTIHKKLLPKIIALRLPKLVNAEIDELKKIVARIVTNNVMVEED